MQRVEYSIQTGNCAEIMRGRMKKTALAITVAGLFVILAVKQISGLCVVPGPPCFWMSGDAHA